MDSVPATRSRPVLANSTQLVPWTSVVIPAVVVIVHMLVVFVHGAAHKQLSVELPAWAGIYVLCIVGVGPVAGLLLLRSSRQRTGATLLFTTMSGALLFGLWKHFVAHGPDHVMDLEAGAWRVPFQATAVLLAVSELAGAVVAFRPYYVLTRQTKARDRGRGY